MTLWSLSLLGTAGVFDFFGVSIDLVCPLVAVGVE